MNKNNNLFSKVDCLSLIEILDYVYDRVSLKERNRMERHMMDCELCNEAADGYRSIKSEKSILDINQKIQKEVRSKEERFGWTKLAAIIATTFIIGGLGYYLNSKLNNNKYGPLANGEAKQAGDSIRPASSKVDSIVALETGNQTGKDLTHKSSSDGLLETNEGNDKNVAEAGMNENFEKINTATPEETRSGPVSKNNLPIAEENTNVSSTNLDKTESLNEESKEGEKQSTTNLHRSVAPSQINDVISVQPTVAKSKAGSKKMKANEMENSPLDSYKDYLEEGKELYQEGKYKEAINSLIKVDQQSKGYEESQWYLGLSYLEIKEMANAKASFEKVIQLKGVYKERATEELNKIK